MAKKPKNKEGVVLYPGMAGLTRDVVEKMKAEGTKLFSVDIMLTQKCNFNCIYCYASAGPDKKRHLTMAEAKKIVDDSADLGVKVINMQGGEPLIWDPIDSKGRLGEAFFHLVEYIRSLFAKRKLPLDLVSFTDVAVIDAVIAKRLAGEGIALCCKLDSLDGNIQDTLLGVKGGAGRMMRGFEHLMGVGYGRRTMPPLSTNTVVTVLNYDGVTDVFRWSRQRNFKPFVIPVHVHGTAKENAQVMLSGRAPGKTLNSRNIKELFEKLSEIDGNEFGIHWKAESPWVENKACSRHLGGVHVRADGTVLPCSEAPDFWALGNIRDESFNKIVSSAKVKKFREIYSHLHDNAKCSPKRCALSKDSRCYGCRTRAYDESGFGADGDFESARLDPQAFFGGDPACWHQ